MNPTEYPELPVLLVDDQESWLHSLGMTLRITGITNILTCTESAGVMAVLAGRPVSAVTLDLTMPHIHGIELLTMIVRDYPEVPVIIITGTYQVEAAVRCMKLGAFDYIVKSVEPSQLVRAIQRAVEMRELRREVTRLRDRFLAGTLEHPEAFGEIITSDDAMHALFRYIETVAPTPQPVLITGESGTGKELVARALHRVSGRRGPFVPVNVAGLDDNMFADTLFGHRKGAFTGASETRRGLVDQASGGTLFLDEIGDLSTVSQVKLLRLLQEREYLPLGADLPRFTDARVVVATNQDLKALERRGRFRNDLYFRLSTHHITLPPLRNRRHDIPLLTDHFLDTASTALGKPRPTPPPELHALLGAYHFPGNVRELESMVYDAVSHHTSRILSLDRFRHHIREHGASDPAPVVSSGEIDGSNLLFTDRLPTLREATELLIAEALRRAQGNQSIAARMLGISRQALNRRLQHDDPPA
jgi:DNA-binding NtrC family response regulator